MSGGNVIDEYIYCLPNVFLCVAKYIVIYWMNNRCDVYVFSSGTAKVFMAEFCADLLLNIFGHKRIISLWDKWFL